MELFGKDTLKEIWKRPYIKKIIHESMAQSLLIIKGFQNFRLQVYVLQT